MEQFTKLDYEQALAYLQQVNAEEMNWRKSRLVLGDLIERGIKAQRALNEYQDAKVDLEKSIQRLKVKEAELTQKVNARQSELNGFEGELKGREQEKVTRLDDLDRVIASKESKVKEVDLELEGVRSRLGLQ